VSDASTQYGFEGRVALVTGAAGGGIGEATARRLAREGAVVAVTDAHAARTHAAVQALRADPRSGVVIGHPLDVGDRRQIDDVIRAVEDQVGTVDILVNNAAVNVLGPLSDYEADSWDRVMDVDLHGCWYLMRTLLPRMMDAGRGSIVNISSVASYLGGGGEGAYAAAKAGLQSLTRTAASEGGPYGVRVNAVAAGIVSTRFVQANLDRLAPEMERVPLRRFAGPDEIANVVAWLVAEESSYVTGAVINASGGWYMSQ
jgi:NAD(P)-dependent dehydrogenase (short-subunit alcohol dehydrogenase family)